MEHKNSIGIVTPKSIQIDEAVRLESGQSFGPVTVTYETYGELNEARSNAVLIAHAFSGDAHAAGVHSAEDSHPGWWDHMIGPGKAFDTRKYFVICSNVLGGCQGTTGPGSIDPATGKPYALSFPVVTIEDMVRVQARVLDSLGIERLLAVAGGSMGGMQAIEWAVAYPERVRSVIVLAATARLSAQAIAFNAVGRNAVMSDPRWNGGNYYGGEQPARGLAIARMVGHITYLSDQSMGMKFGRKLQEREQYGFDFADQFAVESYLEYQGDKFVDRFDANSFIYLTKAIDYYDLAGRFGSLEAAFRNTQARFLVISFSSDWLYPSYQSKEMVFALTKEGKDVSYTELSSPYGHDSFLLESARQTPLISAFLEHSYATQ
jgi:homoserine O-acetyltransferase